MNLKFTHKPNYFFHAQTLIHYLVRKIHADPNSAVLTQHLSSIYYVFGEDFASTTANLEGILNIADNYHVGDESAAHKLIAKHAIDGKENSITFVFNDKALAALAQGLPVIAPNANSYE